jgi:hypothetical protein
LPIYRTHEAQYELPSGWVDGSVNTLEYALPAGNIRLIVTRAHPDKPNLEALVDDRIADQRRKMPFFEQLDRHGKTIAKTPCIEVAITFRDGDKRMYQRSLTLIVGKRMVVMAAHGPDELRSEMVSLFDRVLGSLVVRNDLEHSE